MATFQKLNGYPAIFDVLFSTLGTYTKCFRITRLINWMYINLVVEFVKTFWCFKLWRVCYLNLNTLKKNFHWKFGAESNPIIWCNFASNRKTHFDVLYTSSSADQLSNFWYVSPVDGDEADSLAGLPVKNI